MIQLSPTSVEAYAHPSDWKTQLSQSKMTTAELLRRAGLDSHPWADSSAELLFELRVPASYLKKIVKGDPFDPLLLQVLPQKAEHVLTPGYSDQPLAEHTFTPVKGLLHKYANRVLLITSARCAINCRYCFRRSFPYDEHRQSREQWQDALNYIRSTHDVDEVILSGGDPLVQNNASLLWLLREIDSISHIQRIRIHTRMLTSMPARMDPGLLSGLAELHKKIVLVTHCNHPNELDPQEQGQLFADLRAINITLLNQSVLLRGVNDDAETLARLSKKLFDLGILPYYLFLMDPVRGAAHFDVKETDAVSIYQTLQSKLPGYLVPRLSREIPGEAAKTLISVS